ncbi:aldolase/citrate lyase family protein [Oryzicola mucosus]|uniref:4-hydroxy-2-oxo-heptane-1,7-dioate aldolase n=1 Tax=Oryzicola mucosus TaxID=2767425 RepID=A0A8J6PNK2_9HYPH|nr:aldolase/citrate lyase family protein [Oryzicola mucosus]MBD0416796.1 4-hydroxy-2-oxo-heptane-1,7-dioate aldolase [Oryzicola mucosus]
MLLQSNIFKRALAERRKQLGLWITLSTAFAVEVVAETGYDWLLLDTEHSPGDVLTVLAQLQALSGYPVHPVVRPASNDQVLIKRYLDFGVRTFLIPFVQNAQDARAAVSSIRYPPRGIRGVSALTRATQFGRIKDYFERIEQEVCLLVQIETEQALENIEEIAAVDGVDGIFIGPADLAASMGLIGQPGHPRVLDAVAEALKRINAADRPAGILSSDKAFAKQCLDLGADFVAIGIDVAILARGAELLANEFRRHLEGPSHPEEPPCRTA